MLKSVYLALFHTYLTYSIFNWERANKTTLLLFRLQNKAVRILKYNKLKACFFAKIKMFLSQLSLKYNILVPKFGLIFLRI